MSPLIQLCVALVLLLFRTEGIVSSQQSVYYFFYQRPAYPRDCKEALDSCHYQRSSGVYVVKPDGYRRPFEVYCDNKLDSGGWTVILRRHDGSVTFKRDWLDYKSGFGFLSQELWIGHEKLAFLTNQKIYELRIDVTYSDDTSIYALYSLFRISDAFSNYRLSAVGLYPETNNTRHCPVNMEYGTCFCQSSCGDFQDCQPCPQNEACFCPNGYFLKGTDCVTQEECGCYIDGVTIREGQTYITPGCSKRCSCIKGQLSCDESYQCDPNAACLEQNNIYQCICNEGFIPFGDTCVSICSTNETYGTCNCERSCGNPQGCMPCSTQGKQCYCPNGFYLQGQYCVRLQDCNCFTDGTLITEGQSYISPGCSKRCFCTNGILSCDLNYRCDPNAVCLQQNNMYQCTCNAGFTPSGDTCICSSNEVYGTCTCERFCGNPQVCTPCSTQGQRCYCPTGFYLQGQDCVRQEDCNCFTDGNIIPEGQAYIAPGCTKRCFCINGQLSCDLNYRCDPNAVCLQQNNMYRCTCNAGFTPSGDTCICSSNEVYGTCTCERSCGNPQVCTPCSTQGQRCYCPTGFYLQGQDCVRQEDCNCFTDGNIIPEGHTYIAPGCTKRCFCINGQLSCDLNYRCDPNAVCLQQNNMYRCTCNAGFTPSGDTCICSSNEVYGTCTCERSCENPQVCTPCSTQGQRCHCPIGFYLQGQDCVQQENCNCFTDGNIVPEGATYISAGCSQRCSCVSGQLSCDVYQCSANAVCEERNNILQCYCNAGFTGDGVNCISDTPPSDCQDIYDRVSTQSAVYQIKPTTWQGDSFDVYCNMSDGGGWTVFQRRVDGSQDFFLYWSDYKDGFGTADHELWLGNDKLHSLTSQGNYELRIDLLDSLGSPYYAKYSSFSISDVSDNYRLSLGTYSGTAGDSLSYHDGQAFTTRDRDNDRHSSYNCATDYYIYCDGSFYNYNGAWWYKYCARSSLNSPYGTGAFYWYYLPGGNPNNCNIKYSEMKVRRI